MRPRQKLHHLQKYLHKNPSTKFSGIDQCLPEPVGIHRARQQAIQNLQPTLATSQVCSESTRIAAASDSFPHPSLYHLSTSLLLAELAFYPLFPMANQQMLQEIGVPLLPLWTSHQGHSLSYV